MTTRTVRNTPIGPCREVDLVARVAGDPRFGGLDDACIASRVAHWRRRTS